MPPQISQERLDRIPQEELGHLISPLDSRYYKDAKKVAPYVTEEARYNLGLVVLRTADNVLAKHGEIPQEACDLIIKYARPEFAPYQTAYLYEVGDKKSNIKAMIHDVRAMVRTVQEAIVKAEPQKAYLKGWVYPGFTSYDIINTRDSLALRDVAYEVLIPATIKFERALAKKGKENIDTVLTGRTHLQHAAPTLYGHVAGEEIQGVHPALKWFVQATDDLRGKLSGFVGTRASSKLLFKTDAHTIERETLSALGLKEDELTGQVVHQAFYIPYFAALTAMGGGLTKFAEDIRKYQQTEVSEITEQRLADQVGSSTGAHKRNPIDSENIIGQFRRMMPQLLSVYEDCLTDFQRSLPDSSNKRYYIPEGTAIFYIMVDRATKIAENMTLRKEKMAENLAITGKLILGEPLQLYLQKWTALNNIELDAHEHVRKLTNIAVEQGKPFDGVMHADELVKKALADASADVLEIIEDPKKYVGWAKEDALTYFETMEKELRVIEEKLEEHGKLVYI